MPDPLLKTALTKTAAQGRKQAVPEIRFFFGLETYLGARLSFGSVC